MNTPPTLPQPRWRPRLLLPKLTFLVLALTGLPVQAEDSTAPPEPSNLAQALAAGSTRVDFRYRYEAVDQDGFTEDAQASTLRTALRYASAPYRGFQVVIEAQNVASVGDDDRYNNAGGDSLNNGVRDRPVVADPENTDINQAYVELALAGSTFRVGRQEIKLANQRFVGAVAWRQNHQAFNAVTWIGPEWGRAQLELRYLDRVYRIFGDQRDMGSTLVDLGIDVGPRDHLGAYGYFLDYDRPADFGLSTTTVGLRWTGHVMLDGAKVGYAFEAAQQEDAADNPNRMDADYFLAQVDAGGPAFRVTAGWESLSGSSQDGAFQTPLATLHAFNGWADKFLRTPTEGLQDLYLGLAGGTQKFRWKAVYHEFQPEGSGDDYGSEIDLQTLYKPYPGLTFGLKAALYDADAHATDTDKVMFWVAYGSGFKSASGR